MQRVPVEVPVKQHALPKLQQNGLQLQLHAQAAWQAVSGQCMADLHTAMCTPASLAALATFARQAWELYWMIGVIIAKNTARFTSTETWRLLNSPIMACAHRCDLVTAWCTCASHTVLGSNRSNGPRLPKLAQ